jgi:RNA polymerase sigma-70 factor (ECF subfamily)
VIDKTETQIVESARKGDVGSFGELYARYYVAMVWLAYSILNNRESAEDAAQETFARACGELARLRQPEKFAGWLAAICRNVARQMVRQGKKHVFTDDPSAFDNERADPGNDDETEKLVRQAINRLPQLYRELLTLHYYDGMSYEKIGMVLEIPSHKVKSRLFRARRKIAKYLDQTGFKWDGL